MRYGIGELKTCLGYGLLFTLGWLAVPTLVDLGWAQQQDPPAASTNGNAEQSTEQQRLENLEGLSDEEVRHIYLHEPWRLPNKLTNADQEKIERVIRSVHQVAGGGSGS